MRHLATVRKIDEVLPIEGADAIVLVKIDGWQCVALKNEFKVNDNCVYFEIDSFVPLCPQVEHLRSKAFKRMGDKEGIRIKTIKLRGQLSQGLALPLSAFPDAMTAFHKTRLYDPDERHFDVSEILGVEKYELPVPTQLAGQVKGNFPTFVPKTDQERCQNMGKDIFVANADAFYEVTMKLDGTSFTAYHTLDKDGVCGRNWDLDIEGNETNSLVRMYLDSGLDAVLRELGRDIAVQGELIGPGIQKNREQLTATKLFVFDMYDIAKGAYLTPAERHAVMAELWDMGLDKEMVDHVPVIAHSANLFDTLGITNVDQLLKFAEGPSIKHAIREGLVFKRLDGQFSFKAISTQFLLKCED